jgi:hypothetical protein
MKTTPKKFLACMPLIPHTSYPATYFEHMISNTLIVALACSTLNGVSAISNVDADIRALRGSGQMKIFVPGTPTTISAAVPGALIESGVEGFKKPLTVAEFSEWLHNLYYNEEKKRKAAIDAMLENDPLANI